MKNCSMRRTVDALLRHPYQHGDAHIEQLIERLEQLIDDRAPDESELSAMRKQLLEHKAASQPGRLGWKVGDH